MSFEITDRDFTARIGRLGTKSGLVETPMLLPVINPGIQQISPKTLEEDFGCKVLITNAYIINKNFKEAATDKGLHRFLNFSGSIMTDSGAYQLLVHKDIEITPREIVQFQEEIDTDIATILDIPTGWGVSKEYAHYTVNETIKRAEDLQKIRTRRDLDWVGPVQGGEYLDLVARSARRMGELPFEIHALGSPTPVMEQYKFDILVDMILAAKMNLPKDRPLHLFGAGHPIMFALAIGLGCDLFDSAAYALFAKQDRYMTETGTTRLEEMDYFPCSCPVCIKRDPELVKAMQTDERQKILAEHNLHASFSELKKVKQAIVEGRLWEHIQMRAHGHPSLLQALKRVTEYSDFLEKNSPTIKNKGIFFFDSSELARPEIARYGKRLDERYLPPTKAKILLLLPQIQSKPFHNSKEIEAFTKEINQKLGVRTETVHICSYAAPFGVVPIELDDVYPISQNEIDSPIDQETVTYVARQVAKYIENTSYNKVILLRNPKVWRGKVTAACKHVCKKKQIPLKTLKEKEPWARNTLENLVRVIQEAVKLA